MDQTRATQIWVKISRSVGMAAGAGDWASSGTDPNGLDVIGIGDRADWGDKRFQLRGRSFVIHMLWNGFLLVVSAGVDDRDAARAGWATAETPPGACVRPACAPTPGVALDHAAGSGNADAANCGRSDEPATRATNTPNAATIAMATRHRRVSSRPWNNTVRRMYNVKRSERSQQAVNSIRVWCCTCGYGRKTISGIAISTALVPQ